MKTLTLSLKKKWYDMITSGEKREEYREIKSFWINRFLSWFDGDRLGNYYDSTYPVASTVIADLMDKEVDWRNVYDTVTFTLGYPKKGDTSRRMTFKIEAISIGMGKPEWGAEPDKQYFVIKLGERVKEEQK